MANLSLRLAGYKSPAVPGTSPPASTCLSVPPKKRHQPHAPAPRPIAPTPVHFNQRRRERRAFSAVTSRSGKFHGCDIRVSPEAGGRAPGACVGRELVPRSSILLSFEQKREQIDKLATGHELGQVGGHDGCRHGMTFFDGGAVDDFEIALCIGDGNCSV